MKTTFAVLCLLCAFLASAAPMRVALSYDDGLKDHYEIVAPMLEKYGLRGTFTLVTDLIGRPSRMSWDDVRDLVRRGHDVASHTCSHPRLSELVRAGQTNELVRQIADSRDAINREVRKALPDYSVALLCHPYVDSNDFVERTIRDCGLRPMTLARWNFGNMGKGDVLYEGTWMTTAAFLDRKIAEGATDVDILCHGVRAGVGWESFATPADFENHVRTLARYRDEGRIAVVLERALEPPAASR